MENTITESTAKRLVAIIVVITLVIQTVNLILLSVICGAVFADRKNMTDTADTVYEMPAKLSINASAFAAASAKGQTVDVEIQAHVQPWNALHPEVDFTVAWQQGASRSSEPVTDYLTVTQDEDGSCKATVSCKKAFGSDKIIITVRTREGGFTDTCTVSFVGIATDLSLTSSNARKTSSAKRDEYYEIGTNKTHTFDINLTNAFNTIGNSNLSIKLGASGSLYFGRMTVDDSGFAYFGQMEKRELSSMLDKFITSATISGNKLTITTGKRVVDEYYSSWGNDEYFTVTYYYDHYVSPEDEWGFRMGEYIADDYPGKAAANEAALPSCYFTVTVKDSVSMTEETIRLWIVNAVTGVSVQNTLTV